MGNVSLLFIWKIRLSMRAEGSKLQTEGSKLRAEGSKLRAEGSKLRAEGSKIWAEGDKLWAEAIIKAEGNITITWENDSCILATGERFDP